jgi:hypothetical protein
MNLLNAADEVESLIATARADLAKGKSVNLGPIETRMNEIYVEVSGTMTDAGVERVALLTRLNALVPQLSELEADLTATAKVG